MLLKKQVVPPFVPEIKSSVDLSNFDQKFVKLDIIESMVPEVSIEKIKLKEDAFKEFGFVSTPD